MTESSGSRFAIISVVVALPLGTLLFDAAFIALVGGTDLLRQAVILGLTIALSAALLAGRPWARPLGIAVCWIAAVIGLPALVVFVLRGAVVPAVLYALLFADYVVCGAVLAFSGQARAHFRRPGTDHTVVPAADR